MEETHNIESVLIADCGAVATKLLLFDRVADGYRLLAQSTMPTTSGPPWHDLSVGVAKGIEELETITGRRLYIRERLMLPRTGLEGVDAFALVLSATPPLRIVLAGLVQEMSLASARRAALGGPFDVQATISRENSPRSPQESWARTVRNLAPDVVFLVGGVDGGARRPVLELAESIALAASMMDQDRRPAVLYAGNADLRPRITRLLGDITHVVITENVRPTANHEHLGPAQDALEEFYIEKQLQTAPGIETLNSWGQLPPLPASRAFARVVSYLWHREGNNDRGVLGVDLGAATTTVAATFGGRPYITVREHGSANGVMEWLEHHSIDQLLRWIPDELDEQALLAMLYNIELYPTTVPQTLSELWVALAVAREMFREALELARPTWDSGEARMSTNARMPRIDPILVSGGGIIHTPRPGSALLAILDGLEPVGISTVLLDVNQLAPALGAAASVNPLIAAGALETGAFASLGTVISLLGQAHPGDIAVRLHITYDNGNELKADVNFGEIVAWPLLPDQRAMLEVHPSRHFDIGMGMGRGGEVEVMGGSVGLVVDARGRPLTLPESPDQRRRTLRKWLWAIGG